MNGAAGGTSRRVFLGRAAGAAAAVAGAGVGAGAIAQSAAAADKRSYTAGHFALELDGVSCGKFVGLDGGHRVGNVVVEDPAPGEIIHHKHLAGVKYEDFTLQVGSGMGAGMYQWIKDSFDKGVVRKSGAIIAGDFNYREKRRREASVMAISSVTVPALDKGSKIPANLAVNVSCAKITAAPASGRGVLGQKAKAWLTSNFVFEIDGVDTSRVASIDSFTWKCRIAADGSSGVEIDDIGVSFPRADLSSWKRWYDNMISGADDERNGALTLIGEKHGAVATFNLSNLGLYKMYPVAQRRIHVEMYVEAVYFNPKEYKL